MSHGGRAEVAHLRRVIARIEGAGLQRAARRLPLARALDPRFGGGLAEDALHEIAPAEPADGAGGDGLCACARRALSEPSAGLGARHRRRFRGA